MGLPVNGGSKGGRGPVCFRLIWLRLEGAEHGEEIEALRYGRARRQEGEKGQREGGGSKKNNDKVRKHERRWGWGGRLFVEGFRICDLVLSLCVLSTSQSHKPFR